MCRVFFVSGINRCVNLVKFHAVFLYAGVIVTVIACMRPTVVLVEKPDS